MARRSRKDIKKFRRIYDEALSGSRTRKEAYNKAETLYRRLEGRRAYSDHLSFKSARSYQQKNGI